LLTQITLKNQSRRLWKKWVLNLWLLSHPCIEDGMMLLVLTKEYKQWQKVPEDHHAQHYLYIPYGMLLILTGNVIHAGEFCFGSPKIHANTPKSHSKFTNCYIFSFVQMASLKKQETESLMKYILMMTMTMYQ